jgi:hypothetical protein
MPMALLASTSNGGRSAGFKTGWMMTLAMDESLSPRSSVGDVEGSFEHPELSVGLAESR